MSSIKRKLNEKRAPILAFLTVLILSATIFRQTFIKTLNQRGENEEKEDELARLTKKAVFLENIDRNQLEERVRSVEQVFPSKKPALELLNSLQRLAVEDEVILGEFTLAPGEMGSVEKEKVSRRRTVVKSEMKDLEVVFSISGNFSQVSKFIKDLEKTAPLVKCESLGLSFEDISESEETMVLRASLEVKVFYQALPEAIPAVDSPAPQLTAEEKKTLDELSIFEFYPLELSSGVTKGKEDLFFNPL